METDDFDSLDFVRMVRENILSKNIQIILDTLLSELQRIESLFTDIDSIVTEQEKKAMMEIIGSLKVSTQHELIPESENVQSLIEFIYKLQVHKIIGKSRIELRALFIYAFSVFDYFLRTILKCIYSLKPEMAINIKKELSVKYISKYTTTKELADQVIDDDISDLIRQSYISQFSVLEAKFSIKLKDFPEWKDFVEISQRRNLIVHCDGVISEQYLANCRENGYKCKDMKIGEKLSVDKGYLIDSIFTIKIVASMLAHTLWRKVFTSDLAEADKNLNKLLYQQLREKDYKYVDRLSKFAIKQRHISSESYNRFFFINRCIALQRMGKNKEMLELLASIDWTASSNEFLVAKAVLEEHIDEAITIIKKIGKNSEILQEYAFLEWPLFDNIRDDVRFAAAYKEIYGKDLVDQAAKLLSKTLSDETREDEK